MRTGIQSEARPYRGLRRWCLWGESDGVAKQAYGRSTVAIPGRALRPHRRGRANRVGVARERSPIDLEFLGC